MSVRGLKTRLTVEGLNQTRLIKRLTVEGITLYKVQKIKIDCLKITIKSVDKAKTFAILQKLCYNYSIDWDYSIQSRFASLTKRLGVMLGLLVGSAVSIALASTVFAVRITGLDFSESLKLEREISSVFGFPTFRCEVNLDEVKKVVLSSQAVADCNLSLKGNYLVIETLRQNSEYETKANVDRIVSDSDAIITRVTLREGNALVGVGDVVKAGQTLIDGNVYDTTGQTVIRTVKPSGEVYGEVVERRTVTVTDYSIVKKYTGKTLVTARLRLPYQTLKCDCPFDSCEVSVTSASLTSFIPLIYERAEHKETAFVKIKNDIEATAKELLEDMTAYSVAEVKKTEVDVRPIGGGSYEIRAYVVREKQIGLGIDGEP